MWRQLDLAETTTTNNPVLKEPRGERCDSQTRAARREVRLTDRSRAERGATHRHGPVEVIKKRSSAVHVDLVYPEPVAGFVGKAPHRYTRTAHAQRRHNSTQVSYKLGYSSNALYLSHKAHVSAPAPHQPAHSCSVADCECTVAKTGSGVACMGTTRRTDSI